MMENNFNFFFKKIVFFFSILLRGISMQLTQQASMVKLQKTMGQVILFIYENDFLFLFFSFPIKKNVFQIVE